MDARRCPMYDPVHDRRRLDPLHASERNAKRVVARSNEAIEETQWLLHWMRRFDSPLLGLRPLEC